MTSKNECIQNCNQCWQVCMETINHCLQKGGEHADAEHINKLLDCTETCRASMALMSRESDMHGEMCGTCAEACRRCAESCERFEDDEQMQKCAEICRKCEANCSDMSS